MKYRALFSPVYHLTLLALLLSIGCDNGVDFVGLKLTSSEDHCVCGNRVVRQDCSFTAEADYQSFGLFPPDPSEFKAKLSMVYEDYGADNLEESINGEVMFNSRKQLNDRYNALFDVTAELDPADFDNPQNHRAIINVNLELPKANSGYNKFYRFEQIKALNRSRVFCAYWAQPNGQQIVKPWDFKTKPGEKIMMVAKMLGRPDSEMSLNFHPYEAGFQVSDRTHLGENLKGTYNANLNRFEAIWTVPQVKDQDPNIITGDENPEFIFNARLKVGDDVFDDMFVDDELDSVYP